MTETRDEAFEAMAGRAAELERRVAELEGLARDAAAQWRATIDRAHEHWKARESAESALLASQRRVAELRSVHSEVLGALMRAGPKIGDIATHDLKLAVEALTAQLAEARADATANRAKFDGAIQSIPVVVGRQIARMQSQLAAAEAARVEAERGRQRDAWEAHKNEVVADWKRDVGLLSASQQREAGLREALRRAGFHAPGECRDGPGHECRFDCAALAAHQGAGASLSARALAFALRAFGPHAGNRTERAARLTEEAIELLQAEGGSRELMTALIERACSRPAGEPAKEVGQVGLTLLAYAECAGFDVLTLAARELERIEAFPAEHWQKRYAEKKASGIVAALSPAPAGTKGDRRG